jgi:hypothetical protein
VLYVAADALADARAAIAAHDLAVGERVEAAYREGWADAAYGFQIDPTVQETAWVRSNTYLANKGE